MKKKDLVHEAWYEVDRVGAEKALEGREQGSFLFRKDDFAAKLEDQLKEIHGPKLRCITLTILEKGGQIADHTLVLKQGRWFIYDDDSNLGGMSFESIYSLLDSLGEDIFPLLNVS